MSRFWLALNWPESLLNVDRKRIKSSFLVQNFHSGILSNTKWAWRIICICSLIESTTNSKFTRNEYSSSLNPRNMYVLKILNDWHENFAIAARGRHVFERVMKCKGTRQLTVIRRRWWIQGRWCRLPVSGGGFGKFWSWQDSARPHHFCLFSGFFPSDFPSFLFTFWLPLSRLIHPKTPQFSVFLLLLFFPFPFPFLFCFCFSFLSVFPYSVFLSSPQSSVLLLPLLFFFFFFPLLPRRNSLLSSQPSRQSFFSSIRPLSLSSSVRLCFFLFFYFFWPQTKLPSLIVPFFGRRKPPPSFLILFFLFLSDEDLCFFL